MYRQRVEITNIVSDIFDSINFSKFLESSKRFSDDIKIKEEEAGY